MSPVLPGGIDRVGLGVDDVDVGSADTGIVERGEQAVVAGRANGVAIVLPARSAIEVIPLSAVHDERLGLADHVEDPRHAGTRCPFEIPREAGLRADEADVDAPATTASLTEPPESNSFHSIVDRRRRRPASSKPSCLTIEVAVGDELVADRDRVGQAAAGAAAVGGGGRHAASAGSTRRSSSPQAAAASARPATASERQRRADELTDVMDGAPAEGDVGSVTGGLVGLRIGGVRSRHAPSTGRGGVRRAAAASRATTAVMPITITHMIATSLRSSFLVAHASPPMPGMPLTVSAATIVVHANPTATRSPVNRSGSDRRAAP